MLDSLTNRLTGILDRLRGFGRLTEENIQEALREVRVALLEADVNFKVVKGFIDRVRVKAVGQDVLQSLTPGQQVVKVVRDELVELLGGSAHRLAMAPHPPTVVMLVGLQGSGKTTSAAKLARHFQKQGQHPLLAAADVYRPAAVDQLKTLGAQLGIPVVGEATQRPVDICAAARDEAARRGLSPLILDTAGRLHIDEEMLEELRAIKRAVGPHHVLLVVDAMTGQDAVTVAEKFNAAIGIDAVILTKMDGDARGGAALSVRQVTGPPHRLRGRGREDGRARALPPGPAGPAHPRHGRRPVAGGEGPGHRGRRAGGSAGPEDPRRRVHAGGLRDAAQAAPLHGPARAAHGHGARSSRAPRGCPRRCRARSRSWTGTGPSSRR